MFLFKSEADINSWQYMFTMLWDENQFTFHHMFVVIL